MYFDSKPIQHLAFQLKNTTKKQHKHWLKVYTGFTVLLCYGHMQDQPNWRTLEGKAGLGDEAYRDDMPK